MTEENIRVSIRVRPLNKREEDSKEKEAWRVVDGCTIVPTEHNHRQASGNSFTYDNVFDYRTTSQEVYDKCAKEIICSALQGQNGTIFVYGQTSSGKTHTMQGTSLDPGIVPLGISSIFEQIKKSPKQDFLVRCSYIEIYNECITDLLNPKHTNLKILTSPKGGVYVAGVTEPFIANAPQALDIVQKGISHRHVGETRMNEASSRSHSIFRMVIESRDRTEDSEGAVRIGELNMVDLAGSERQSQTQATGARLKEGANINKSLLTLGNVIAKLSEGGEGQHIPYRDSKLTRILEPALGGNARTSIVGTITPALMHGEETLSTLKFALRARSISNTATVNETLDDQAMLRRYKKEIDQLKKKLRYTSAGGEKDMEICSMMNQLESLRDEKQALEEEKLVLMAEHQEKERKIARLADLVVLSGASMSAEAPLPRKAKPTVRMSWCPTSSGIAPSHGRLGGNRSVLGSSIIEEADEEGEELEDSTDDLGSFRPNREQSPPLSESMAMSENDQTVAGCADDGSYERVLSENERLVGELCEEREHRERLQEIVDRMQEGRFEADDSTTNSLQTIGAFEGSGQEMESSDSSKEAAIRSLERSLSDSEDQRRVLIGELESVQDLRKQELASHEAEMEAAAQRIFELTRGLDDEKTKSSQYQGMLQEMEAALRQVADQADESKSERDGLLSKIDVTMAELTKAQGMLSEEVQKNSVLESQVNSLQEKLKAVASLTATLHTTEAMLEQSERDFLEQKEALDNAVKDCERWRDSAEKAASDLQCANEQAQEQELEAMRVRARIEEEVELLKKSETRLQAEQEELMARLVDAEEQLDAAKNTIQDMRLTEQELRCEVADLQEAASAHVARGPQSAAASKRMSTFGPLKSESSFGSATRRESVYTGPGAGHADAASLRRELGAKEQRCADLEKARDKAEKALEHLKSELATVKEELVQAKKEIRTKSQKATSLEKSQEDNEKDKEKLKTKVVSLEEKLKVLNQEKSSISLEKSAADRENRKHAEKIEALEKEAEKLRQANQKLKETTAALAIAEKRAEAAIAELEETKNNLDQRILEIQTLTSSLNESRVNLEKITADHLEISTAHSHAVSQNRDLQEQQIELERLCEDCNQQIKTLTTKMTTSSGTIAELQEQKAGLEAALGALQQQARISEEENKRHLKTIEGLQKDLDDAENQVDSISKRFDAQKAEVIRLQGCDDLCRDLKEQVRGLREDQLRTFNNLTDANFELQQLKAEYQALQTESSEGNERMDVALQRAKEELRESEEEKSRLRMQFAQFTDTTALMDSTDVLNKRIAALEAELLEKGTELVGASQKHCELAAQSAMLRQDLQTAEAQNDSLAQERQDLRQDLDMKERECARLKSDLEEIFVEHKKAQGELCVAKEESYRQTIDHAELKGQLSGAEKEIASLQGQLRAQAQALMDFNCKFDLEVSSCREKIYTLQAENDQLRLALDKSSSKLTALEMDNETLAGELQSKDSSNSTLAQDLRNRTEECQQQGSLCQKLEGDLLKIKLLLQSTTESDNEKCKSLSENQCLISALQSEARANNLRLEDLQAASLSLSQRCDRLESEKSVLQNLLETKDSTGAKIAETVSKLSDELEAMRTLNHQLEVQQSKQGFAYEQALETIRGLEERQAEAEELSAQIGVLQARNAHLQQLLDELRQECEKLVDDNKNLRSAAHDTADMTISMSAMASELLGLREGKATLDHQVEEMKASSLSLSQRCDRLESEKSVLQHLLEMKDSTGAKIAETVSKLSDELEAMRTLNHQLEVQQSKQGFAYEQALETIRGLEERKAEAEMAKARHLAASEDLKQLQQGMERCLRESQAKDAAIAQHREEASRLRARLGPAQQRVAELEGEVKEITHKAVMIKAEYHGRIDRREKQIEALTAKLAEASAAGKGAPAAPVDKENRNPQLLA